MEGRGSSSLRRSSSLRMNFSCLSDSYSVNLLPDCSKKCRIISIRRFSYPFGFFPFSYLNPISFSTILGRWTVRMNKRLRIFPLRWRRIRHQGSLLLINFPHQPKHRKSRGRNTKRHFPAFEWFQKRFLRFFSLRSMIHSKAHNWRRLPSQDPSMKRQERCKQH